MAYATGEVSTKVVWEDEKTMVTMSMSGENYDVQLNIDHESKKHTLEILRQLKDGSIAQGSPEAEEYFNKQFGERYQHLLKNYKDR